MRPQTKNVVKTFGLRHFFLLSMILFQTNVLLASGAKRPNVPLQIEMNLPITETKTTSPTIMSNSPQSTTQPTGLIGSTKNNTQESNQESNQFSYLDPNKEIPHSLLQTALLYYQNHSSTIKNKATLGIIDFSQHSSKERFYLIDMQSGAVDKYQVAHGKNSDPDYNGFATNFSNIPNSLMSSQGFYLTAETYNGTHGYSLKLDGLSPTNSNARVREIVIHPADYVIPGDIIGRSWGCPALDPRYSQEVINRIKGGILIYAL